MSSFYLVLVSLLFSPNLFADQKISKRNFDRNYFSIHSVEAQELNDFAFNERLVQKRDRNPPRIQPLTEDIDVGQVINIGKEIWKIIVKNKPVVNVKTDVASALPAGSRSWIQLQGWQTPVSKLYRVVYKNLYGMEVVRFDYRVLYTYGGNANGVGKYLAQITVLPAKVSVAWGFTFNAVASVDNVMNAGTHSDPVGGAQISVRWTVDTVMKHIAGGTAYFMRGDGLFVDLNK